MKVLMLPHVSQWTNDNDQSGIRRVVEAYFRYLPAFGVEFVARNATDWDIKVTHAGMGDPDADVAMTHGLYWSADYDAPNWEHKANANVVAAVRHAKEVTVPSAWVAEAFQRDMRFSPHIVSHGIEWEEWQHEHESESYALWNKNRTQDVCSTDALRELARAMPGQEFVSTFRPSGAHHNIRETGVIPHAEMRELIQRAGVYLSTTKETFGIGVLEAMASGVPVLGYRHGGNVDLVQHGVNGYLAEPGNTDDLIEGLHYCRQHRNVLGANGREMARQWTWESACAKVWDVFRFAMEPEPATVSIIIPSYNYADKVSEAIRSACKQTYLNLVSVIVVDDGSTDNTREVVESLMQEDVRIGYIYQQNAGVANARNRGITLSDATYIACLDADDALEPDFLETLIPHIHTDRSLGCVYSGLRIIAGDGRRLQGRWPDACDFDAQLKMDNQVPTCCVFRRKAWERLGGYKQRYAPMGQGVEDAEFWLRMGAYGWGMKQVTKRPLFLYTWGGRTTNNPDYEEVDWTALHPWTKDGQHPFASLATPRLHSHPVRQYDEPTVSVVIPVGPGHGRDVVNALDSLESQVYRRWEAIVVDDTGGDETEYLRTAYPYVRFVPTDGRQGAGYARNRGAEIARAPLLLFLDADDWLYPNAIRAMLAAWQEHEAIAYTDYVGKAIISEEHADQLEEARRLLQWKEDSGEAVIRYFSADYDCERAQRQPEPTGDPNMPFYHWCLVTALLPTEWHNEIGGFDESMNTWEDVDYHWRLARAGRCYVRINDPLVVYNFHTGHRREDAIKNGGQAAQKVVQYIRQKYEGGSIVPCSGCSKKVAKAPVFAPLASGPSAKRVELERAQNEDFVLVKYLSQNRGNHPVVGHMTKTSYGYRKGGDKFLVHKRDVWENGTPNGRRIGPFDPIPREVKVEVQTPKVKRETRAPRPVARPQPIQPTAPRKLEPLPMPEEPAADEPLDLQDVLGVTASIAAQMREQGITTKQQIIDLGLEGLQKFKGCAATKAGIIMDYLTGKLETD